MLITSRYAFIISRELARAYRADQWLTALDLSELYNINIRVLIGVIRRLTQSGILIVKKEVGISPQYMLSRDPDTMTLYDLWVVMEGEMAFLPCWKLIPGLQCRCNTRNRSPKDCKFFSTIGYSVLEMREKLSSIPLGGLGE